MRLWQHLTRYQHQKLTLMSWHNHFSIMEICKTDVKKILRYLTDAASFYDAHAKGFVEKDRPRLLSNMARKIARNMKEITNHDALKP